MATEEKRKYDRDYYANRSVEKKKRKILLQKKRQRKTILEVNKIKSDIGCADCNETDSIVLEFDHRCRDEKYINISDAVRLGWALEKIKVEINKCDVVCANCHRRRTAKQMKWRI